MEKVSMENLARLSVPAYKEMPKYPLVVVLDNVRSGLNVGSVFRTADAFAIEKIVLCGITAQPPHREILKTALGSTDSVQWTYQQDTATAVLDLQAAGYQVWAVEQTDRKVWLNDFTPEADSRYAIVLGNEVEGVDADALRLCNGVIEIPQFGTKHSLNVSVAAGIVIWDIVGKMQRPQHAD